MSARYDWESIRAEYEAGASQADLSRRHGVSRKAIQKHITAEGWTQGSSGTVNRMAEDKVAGIVAGCDPKKKAEALNRAADAVADVITEQREAWKGFDGKVTSALEANDFERLKCLKIASEALRNAQECQRRAWGIADKSIMDMTSSDGSMSPARPLTPKEVAAELIAQANASKQETPA